MLGRLSIIIQVLWSKQNPLFPISIKNKNINFIVLLAIKQKKPSVNKTQIDNLVNHYSETFSPCKIKVHQDAAEIWKWTFRLKVTTRRKIRKQLNSIYHDEIMFKVVVFKKFSI